jgi:hypothetical protein
MSKNYNNRIGETKYNNNNELMKIVKYKNSREVYVQFQDQYHIIIKVTYGNFKSGNITNPYNPIVYNKGMLGIVTEIKNDKYYTKATKVWRSMLQRCYDKKLHNIESTYQNCKVCDEWLLFTNFYDWFKQNYYELESESVQLDKDILHKGNKIYCPENCCFVPHTINSLFTKSDKMRGNTLIGVYWVTRDKVYRAQCNDGHKNHIALGDYHSETDAFHAYKTYKEKVIKKIAEEYKNTINLNVYQALLNYQVEQTD